MQVEMYVDEIASWVSTPESEYADIELNLREYIFGDSEAVRFKPRHPTDTNFFLYMYLCD